MRDLRLEAIRQVLALVRIQLVLQCDCPSGPTRLLHVFFELCCHILQLLQYLLLVSQRIERSDDGCRGALTARKNVPLNTNTLALVPLHRLHRIGCDTEVRTEKEMKSKLFVHDEQDCSVRIDVSTGLRSD
jgi:hypothetical protein